ncbi:hypothetical protein CDAR_237361 [Caerostris darwini]|uniref:Uncharacterized protein n=1 Tax=Caerostris darwini TaxID=1538125 RepID=A0AAV4QVS1_9ARAC|nr:hypothetical protein CDAR_237361 [Caerostris darwini]
MPRLHPDKRKEADSFHYQHFRMAGPVKQCNETHEQFLGPKRSFKPFELKQDRRKEADSFHYQHFRMAGPVKQCNETHEQFLAQRDPLNPLSLNKALGFFDSLARNRCCLLAEKPFENETTYLNQKQICYRTSLLTSEASGILFELLRQNYS